MCSPNIKIQKGEGFFDNNSRRSIAGLMDVGVELSMVDQIKVINLHNNMVVGNHGHKVESGQYEFIFVVELKFTARCIFKGRNPDGSLVAESLAVGHCVTVPPGCSLSLGVFGGDATIIEISNKSYDASNYFEDVLQ